MPFFSVSLNRDVTKDNIPQFLLMRDTFLGWIKGRLPCVERVLNLWSKESLWPLIYNWYIYPRSDKFRNRFKKYGHFVPFSFLAGPEKFMVIRCYFLYSRRSPSSRRDLLCFTGKRWRLCNEDSGIQCGSDEVSLKTCYYGCIHKTWCRVNRGIRSKWMISFIWRSTTGKTNLRLKKIRRVVLRVRGAGGSGFGEGAQTFWSFIVIWVTWHLPVHGMVQLRCLHFTVCTFNLKKRNLKRLIHDS